MDIQNTAICICFLFIRLFFFNNSQSLILKHVFISKSLWSTFLSEKHQNFENNIFTLFAAVVMVLTWAQAQARLQQFD